MRLLILLSFLFLSFSTNAQVGIGTTTPNISAALDIKDTARGLLIPRLTLNQRTSIANPAEGLMVYQTNAEKGFWYFDGVQWLKSGSGSNNTGGKNIFVLNDTVTNAQAQAKILAEVGPNTQVVRIFGCTNLTTLDLSLLQGAAEISIQDNPVLQSINLSNLVNCDGDFFIEDCPLLASINLNSLQKVASNDDSKGGFGISNTGITGLSLPAFKKCIGGFAIEDNTVLGSISLPVAASIISVRISYNPVLSSLLFPGLVTAGHISITDNNVLASVSFPALTSITRTAYPNYTSITGNSNLSAVSMPNLTQYKNVEFSAAGNKLPAAVVNSLLRKFVTITPSLTGKTIDVSQQSPAAPPTGQGVTDKSTLTSNGNTVLTD